MVTPVSQHRQKRVLPKTISVYELGSTGSSVLFMLKSNKSLKTHRLSEIIRLEKEIHAIRLGVVKFLYNLVITACLIALAIYIYNLAFNQGAFGPNSIIFFPITIFVTLIYSLVRFRLNNKNYSAALLLVVIGVSILVIFYAIRFGTYATLQYLLLTIVVLAVSIVYGFKQTVIYSAIIFILYVAILLLHNSGLLDYQPYLTDSDFSDTVIAFILLWLIINVGRIGFAQIEISYNKAISYSTELEKINKNLDKLVKERTELLKLNYDKQLESMYNTAIIGSIAKPLLHDLATPVSALMGTVFLMRNSKYPDNELLNLAEDSSKQIAYLINESRDLIRGKNIIEVFDTAEHTRRAIRILQHELDRSDIVMKTNLRAGVYIKGTIGIFERIIINILVNSIEELKNINLQRKISVSSFLLGEEKLVIEILDNGRGVAPEYLVKLFNEDFSSKHSYYNLGLGLPFVKKQLSEKFSGRIEIESELNKYTKVIITFDQIEN